VAHLMYQLLAALDYCHLRSVVHRDIKPPNMMILYPKEGGHPDLKLIDFGLSEKGSEMRDYVGSPLYMAPEIHRRSTYTSKADIWSAGITAMELLAGKIWFPMPYADSIGKCKDPKELEKHVGDAWTTRSTEVRAFVRSLLQTEARQRPDAESALFEPWMDENRPDMRKFPKVIAQSLHGYASATSVMRCCLHSIAARVGAPDMPFLGHAFLGADSDGDGLISDEDLEEALDNLDGLKWWCDPAAQVDVDKVLRAGDLDHRGGLSFTEFVAACLFQNYGRNKKYAELAFHALDGDRDGLIRTSEIKTSFRERDKPFLATLPQNEAFNLEEWQKCVDGYECDSSSSSGEETTSTMPSWMQAFMCSK